MTVSFGRAAWAIFKKDVRLELRTRELITTAGFFAVLVCVLASIAFFADQATVPGAIWIPVSFASVLALSRTWQRERDDGALTALMLAPIPRAAIFVGKALGVFVFLLTVLLLVVPVVGLFFHIDLRVYALGLLLIGVMGAIGIAAIGTLFGVITVRTRARDLLLSVIVFPLMSPALITGISAVTELLRGAALLDLSDYFVLLGMYDLGACAGGAALFGFLLDE